MRHLKIDITDLELAFESGFEMTSWYLDLDSGEVISVIDDTRSVLNKICDSYYDEQTQTIDWEKASEEEDVPDWQHDLVKEAYQAEMVSDGLLISIPPDSSSDGYADMVAFIDTVRDPQLEKHLVRAINWRGPFRNFKEVLFDYPSEREHWFQFKQERLRSRILEWLDENDITIQE